MLLSQNEEKICVSCYTGESMQKCWIHRELRVAPRGYYASSSQLVTSLSYFDVHARAWRFVMGLFYATSVCALALATFALLHLSTRAHGVKVIESFASDLLPRALSHQQWLLERTVEQQASLEPDIRFLADIIEKRTNRVSAYNVARAIVIASKREKFDPLLAAAIISSESTFNPYAESNRGALGLMQLRPRTGEYIASRHRREWHGTTKLTDPIYNIELGIAYFRYLERLFKGNREHALVAYNWGPTNLSTALERATPIPSGPQQYAKKILKTYAHWSALSEQRVAMNVIENENAPKA